MTTQWKKCSPHKLVWIYKCKSLDIFVSAYDLWIDSHSSFCIGCMIHPSIYLCSCVKKKCFGLPNNLKICSSFPVSIRHSIMTSQSADETNRDSLIPAPQFSTLHLTTLEAVVTICHQLLPVWKCLSRFFPSRRWLTTPTADATLFQHIMVWLMCVDEQPTAWGAPLSIMHRWAKPAVGVARLSLSS